MPSNKASDALIKRLAIDLTAQFGRGFGWRNLLQMRAFYLAWPDILQTPSAICRATRAPPDQRLQTATATSAIALSAAPSVAAIANQFPLPWSAYVRLLSVRHDPARQFYEAEALRGGWSVRQLDRQINTASSTNGWPCCAVKQGAGGGVQDGPAR